MQFREELDNRKAHAEGLEETDGALEQVEKDRQVVRLCQLKPGVSHAFRH